MEVLMSGFERLERERPAALSQHALPPRAPAHDDHAAAAHVADPHELNQRAEQMRRRFVKERARAAGAPEPEFGPLSEAPDLYSLQARPMTRRSTAQAARADAAPDSGGRTD